MQKQQKHEKKSKLKQQQGAGGTYAMLICVSSLL